VTINPEYALGRTRPFASVSARLTPRAVAAAILLAISPGDRPLINAVAAAFLAGDLPVARPVFVGADGRRVPGHPVFLARGSGEVEELRGDEGARSLLSAHPSAMHAVSMDGEPPGDIDNLGGLREACAS